MASLISSIWQAVGPHAAQFAALCVCLVLYLQIVDHNRTLEVIEGDLSAHTMTLAAVDREQAVRQARLAEIETKLRDARQEVDRLRDLVIDLIRHPQQAATIADEIEADQKRNDRQESRLRPGR